MHELLLRLAARPFITVELLLASLLANLLALASPIYVIQVLNRYLTYGIDATLLTLTSGVLLAMVLEFAFRGVRMRLAELIGERRNPQLMVAALGVLVSARVDALARYPRRVRQELLNSLEVVESTYSALNITALLDLPFALLFLGVLLLLSPPLGGIAALFALLIALYAVVSQRRLGQQIRQLSERTQVGNDLILQANQCEESLRLFDRAHTTLHQWQEHTESWLAQRRVVARQQGLLQNSTASLQAAMGVAIYAVGAQLVMAGEIDSGMLIGANILAARALGPVIRFAQMGEGLVKSRQALERLTQFAQLEVEAQGGTARKSYSGALQLHDVAFSYSGMVQPLYESLNLDLPAGTVLLLSGRNGSGKTTFARLLTGLLTPTRGKILADGVDLNQLAPAWWRNQITYLPQEPELLHGTLRQTLLTAQPELTPEAMEQVLADAGLTRWVAESREGLDIVVAGGAQLSLGHRRRVALARALAVGGAVVILDEPTEGLDHEGRQMIYTLLLKLARQGRTIIFSSDDPTLQRAATRVLDLDSKPVPRLIVRPTPTTGVHA